MRHQRRAASTRSAKKRSRPSPLRDSFTFLLSRLRALAFTLPMPESLPPVWPRCASAHENLAETPRGDEFARLVECLVLAVDGGPKQADVELINLGPAWIGSLWGASHTPLSDSRSLSSYPAFFPHRLRAHSAWRRTPCAATSGCRRGSSRGTRNAVSWRPQAARLKFAPSEESRIHRETQESRFGRAGIARRRNASDDFHRSRSPGAAPSW